MESPGEPASSFHLFPLLPYELRLEIIESWLCGQESTSSVELEQSTGRGRLAEYATVDKQWKSVIEKRTFRSLSLPFTEIYNLGRICVQDRIRAFSEIHLNIILDRIGDRHTRLSFDTTHDGTTRGSSSHDENDQSFINTKRVEPVQDLIPILERLPESGLRTLDVAVLSKGFIPRITTTEPELYTLPSLPLSRAMVATRMTCKLEKLSLINVIDVPYFLKESCVANGNTLRSPPIWPNIRSLILCGYITYDPLDLGAFATWLHDHVTIALPNLPNMTTLSITMHFPIYIYGRRYWNYVMVDMRIAPRDDRLALRDGRLLLHGPKPDPETINKWKEVARRQWHCELRCIM